MIVDTSALLALFHPKEPHHPQVAALFEQVDEPLVVSPYVIAELDYLVLSRAGVRNELAVLRALLTTAWEIAPITDSQMARAADLVEQYANERICFTDAMNVILASDYRTSRIATLDHRHFTILRLPNGDPVEILP